MNGYDALAFSYDALNTEVDYKRVAEYIAGELRSHGIYPPSLVLDLGCGTGKLCVLLSDMGYDMIGVDLSEEMLSEARKNAGDRQILWLVQDICKFELYGTVAAIVSTMDTLNHVTDPEMLRHTFALCRNYLDPDGVLLFDLNSQYKFETVYAGRDYVLEDEGVMLTWQNDYDPETRTVDFYISVFSENEDGLWTRRDSEYSERLYGRKEIISMLGEEGFSLCRLGDSYTDTAEKADSLRLTFTFAKEK